jgi:hypothetical protein
MHHLRSRSVGIDCRIPELLRQRVAQTFEANPVIIECVITSQLQTTGVGCHPPVVPCELPDGIRLVYADDRGRQHTVELAEACQVNFGMAKPLRKPPAYRGQRNFPGWWWSATTRTHVLYESWLERHYIVEADRDARVTGISGQPFALTWPSGKKRDAIHFPDLFCPESVKSNDCAVRRCDPSGGERPSPVACRSRSL